jgi:hypothetical protein
MVGLDLRRVGVAATIEVIMGFMSSKWPLVVMVVVDIVLYKDVRSMKGLAKTMIGYLIRWYRLAQLLSCDNIRCSCRQRLQLACHEFNLDNLCVTIDINKNL